MSMETSQWLNTQTLIGMTEQRGNAWHHRAEDQGEKSNHYPGFIPVGDVIERLFYWEARNAKLSIEVPATSIDEATGMGEDGTWMRKIVDESRNVTYHPETGAVFGVFKTESIHQYKTWLLENLAHLVTADGLAVTTDSLGIGSAGLLRGGAQAWVQLEPADNWKTPEGVDFRPHLTAYSSHDGSLATTYGAANTLVVCDNTMAAAREEMRGSGLRYRVKRSAKSMNAQKLSDARQAMNLVIESAQGFADQIADLCKVDVSERQWQAFLGEWAPIGDKKGRAKTNAETKRESLDNLWRNDERVEPWAGTALGVVQATNTYDHHLAPMKGELTRAERNTSRAIEGEQAKSDETTLRLLDLVLANS